MTSRRPPDQPFSPTDRRLDATENVAAEWRAIGAEQERAENIEAQASLAAATAERNTEDVVAEALRHFAAAMASGRQVPSVVFLSGSRHGLLYGWRRKTLAYVVLPYYPGGNEGGTRPGIAVTPTGHLIELGHSKRSDAYEGVEADAFTITSAVRTALPRLSGIEPVRWLNELLVARLRSQRVTL